MFTFLAHFKPRFPLKCLLVKVTPLPLMLASFPPHPVHQWNPPLCLLVPPPPLREWLWLDQRGLPCSSLPLAAPLPGPLKQGRFSTSRGFPEGAVWSGKRLSSYSALCFLASLWDQFKTRQEWDKPKKLLVRMKQSLYTVTEMRRDSTKQKCNFYHYFDIRRITSGTIGGR